MSSDFIISFIHLLSRLPKMMPLRQPTEKSNKNEKVNFSFDATIIRLDYWFTDLHFNF